MTSLPLIIFTFCFGVLLLWDVTASPLHNEPDNELKMDAVLHELDTWQSSGEKQIPASLKLHLSQLGVIDALKGLLFGYDKQATVKGITCFACTAAARLVFRYLNEGKTIQEIMTSVINLCINFGVSSDKVCQNIIKFAAPEMLTIVMHTTIDLKPDTVCGVMLQGMGCGKEDPALEWTVDVDLGEKPTVNPIQPPKPGKPTLKVVHLTDLHYDPAYLVGGNVNCEDIMCCREEHGLAADSTSAAGYWGEYDHCDAPWQLLEHIFQHVAQQHNDIDYLMMTGDLPSHHIWATSRENNLEIIKNVTSLIRKYFPNTTIFPALGNHEPHPVNSFPTPEVEGEYNISWLYEPIAEQWSIWLPERALHTVRHGGYYSILARPGLRLIVINSNLCYCLNWWLMYGPNDPAQQLKWLAGELLAAEQKGEKVHIIGHVPPGHRHCFMYWSREFHKLVNRFESIITAQFYGHTHKDEVKIAYDSVDPSRAISVEYLSVSATPWYYLNPGYRIYYIDGDYEGTTRMVVDHDTHVFNLTEANLEGTPKWYKLYSAKEAYQMESLLPQEWDKVVRRMVHDEDFFQLYYRNFAKNADYRLEEGCDDECKEKLICRVVTSDWSDQRHCDTVKQELQAHRR